MLNASELRGESDRFLGVLTAALQSGNHSNVQHADLQPAREMLTELSRSRGRQGFSPTETAAVVFSLK